MNAHHVEPKRSGPGVSRPRGSTDRLVTSHEPNAGTSRSGAEQGQERDDE
jgi:hypothetical protein